MSQKRNIILGMFCHNLKRRFYLRELSRLSRIPLRTTSRVLEELEKSGIILSKCEGRNKYFELNLGSIKARFLIQGAEIWRTIAFLERYLVFKSFLKEIKPVNCAVIIYGSFAESKAARDSDLDVLIVCDKEPDLPEYILPYTLHKVRLSKSEFLRGLEKDEPLLREILLNHIILYNHSFFVDAMWWYYGRRP